MENLKVNDTIIEDMDLSTEIEEGMDLSTEIETEVEEGMDLSTEIETEVEEGMDLSTEIETEIEEGMDLSTEIETEIEEGVDISTEIEAEIEEDIDLFKEIETEIEEDIDLFKEIETEIEEGVDISTKTEIEIEDEFDLFKLKPSKSENITRSYNGTGAMSIVNSTCGKRISFTQKSMEMLNSPEMVQFSFDEKTIAFGEKIPNADKKYTVKTTGKKYIVYAANLVDEITEALKLDFTEKTSITFYDVKYTSYEGSPVAMIKVKK